MKLCRTVEYCHGKNRLDLRVDPTHNGRIAAILKFHYHICRVFYIDYQQVIPVLLQLAGVIHCIEPVSYTHLTLPTNREV